MIELSIPNCFVHVEPLPLDQSIEFAMQSWLKEEHAKYGIKRKQDFLGGRFCAMKACEKMGYTLSDLPIGPHRNPLWPKSITGSITHSKDFVLAVVTNYYQSVGVDAETLMGLERYQNIKRMIVNPQEDSLITQDLNIFPTLVFSAKETLYKAIYPLCETFFGFLDAQVLEINQDELKIELLGHLDALKPHAGVYSISYRKYPESVVTWMTIKPI